MKILHLSPTYFGERSVIGGGERYAHELARSVAQNSDSIFLSFAEQPSFLQEGKLRLVYLKKGGLLWNVAAFFRFLKYFFWADVIHCYQVRYLQTDFAIFLGKIFNKRVFVTDLGGGASFAFSDHFPVLKWSRGFLLISQYSKKLWAETSPAKRPQSLAVIYGGVDTNRFCPGKESKVNRVLFVGRLLAHKGIDILIDALDEHTELHIVGRPYDARYFQFLREKSIKKRVTFLTDLDDKVLIREYREASVTVQPSVYENCYGEKTVVPELLGLAALESMACGTPAIVTDVASLPEIVEDGVTGFVVPPNQPGALREKINYLLQHPEIAARMGKKANEEILKRWTWRHAAERCLKAYEQS